MRNNSSDILERRVAKILPNKDGLERLMSKKKIRVYFGVDPTSTKLHLGHTIGLRTLQDFADAGHEAILLFGTGTVLVGDPSLRKEARKTISQKIIEQNIKTWEQQVKPIIDFNKIEIKQNGDWLTKLTLKDIVNIASKVTAVQLFKRESFQRRIEQGSTVWYHETMYPLLQGYDSVAMDVDLEIGGTDQEFNMLMGRELQKKINHREKFVLITHMITGTDGKPMSKTSGNCIWLTDSANDMFGKIMKIRDDLMPNYFEFFTDKPTEEIKQLKQNLKQGRSDPISVKKNLAHAIASQFHGQIKANEALHYFETVTQKKQAPENTVLFYPSRPTLTSLGTVTQAELAESNSQAKRIIQQGGFSVDNKKITNPKQQIKYKGGEVIKFGKRDFRKVKIEKT
ncbi:MAG: Tyrosine-tRNA ligase [Candidatus Beckwithbacteria bacterium GW2011_GWB1_47_15]|uniref:Tyrosine--tRNA ligase n=1 Tax=Candidatus Beckwithbacteria bacterium GW2011_GWB1_47_15 TaxID=1618371 RepID=A0A0G1RW69_9BACT|nr:MAG: Tyrosyl-tRNA synthetase, tyrosyl-tRNA synthetase [Candidatus Beckwithbacteria bacterium GW2011_GWC1_49_16]KKU35271.1 MAG: Tyrosine-tRNA ligase [Candidatus Beckwithbacteria bacterium GW2011_GWA1_46_30]KKU61366.1 MAG: Tyrosine-tRNA ligase [Candidatus Beckwithbacteria bacterium GW2011_GWB1_47_15]KKU71773.1 MAG: Tyrosine-tRNA ligase [Candidatus Beckwithbacteria bacterium GW2011_GWA2_47_25]KKW03006.1 MAG: Tyrosine-tRNA ligase [Candidatus Beckwithbacteria bacterium GW2011_GWC2_49_11]OGD48720